MRALAFVALMLFAHGGLAHEDHEEARRLVEEGTILPLATLLQRLDVPPEQRVIEAELKHRHGRYLYEIELLRPDGVVEEYLVDAADGRMVERRR